MAFSRRVVTPAQVLCGTAIAVPYTAIVLLSVYILNRIGIILLKEGSLSEHFFLVSNIIIAILRH